MNLLLNKASLIWVLLVVATALSWAIGSYSPLQVSFSAQSAQTLILIVTFFKIRLVLMHFMEVGDAPPSLRWTGEAWVVLMLFTLIVVTYL